MSGGVVTAAINVKTQDGIDALRKLAEQEELTRQQAKTLEDGLDKQAAALEKMARAADPAYNALVKLNEAQARANLLVDTGRMSTDEAERSVSRLQQAYDRAQAGANKAAAGANDMGHANAGAAREFVVLGHEVISGNFSRIPGSLMVLAERSGKLGSIIGAITSPVGIAASGLAALGAASIALAVNEESATRESNTLITAFSAMGKGAGVTVADMRNLVNQVAELHGINHEAAVEIISDLARTRDLGGAAFADLTKNADKYAAVMGTTAPEATKELAKAFSGNVDAIHQLDQQYNILSSSQAEQIRQMGLIGDKAGAAKIAQDAWHNYAINVRADLTPTQHAADGLAQSWDRLIHTMGDSSAVKVTTAAWNDLLKVMTTVVDFAAGTGDVDRAQRRLTESQAQYDKLLSASHGASGYARQLAILKEQIDASKKALDEAKAAANQNTVNTGAGSPLGKDGNDPQEQIKAMTQALSAYAGQQARVKDLNVQIEAAQKLVASAKGEDADRLKLLIADATKYRDELAKVAEVPSRLPQWQTELASLDAAENQSRIGQLTNDADYWRQILQRADLSAKERQQINKQLSDEEIQINRAASEEADRLDRQDAQIKRDHAKTDIDLLKMGEEAQLASISSVQSKTIAAAQAKLATEEALTQDLAANELQRIQLEQQGLDKGSVEYQKYADDIRKIEGKLDLDLAQLRAASAQEQLQITQTMLKSWQKDMQSAVQPIGRAFDTIVSDTVKGSTDMRTAFSTAGKQMATSYIEDIAGMTARFLAYKALTLVGWTQMATMAVGTNSQSTAAIIADWLGLTTAQATSNATGVAESKASAAEQVPAYTAIAAMGAASSVASAPFAGPAMAAAAAGEMDTLGAAQLAIASAYGGFGQVPYDGLTTELHKDEMVLPAYLATPLRSMVGTGGNFSGGSTGAGTGSSGPASAGGGPAISFNISAIDAAGVARFFQQNGQHVANAVATQYRLANTNLGNVMRGTN